MPKTKIYRRFFDPKDDSAKKVRQLVAVFQSGMEHEASETLAILQHRATDIFKESYFSKFRYEAHEEAEPITPPSQNDDIQIDLSKAIKTKRPIVYECGWHVKHDICYISAWHVRYGSIRGEVENSVAGRKLFFNRLETIWPNSEAK